MKVFKRIFYVILWHFVTNKRIDYVVVNLCDVEINKEYKIVEFAEGAFPIRRRLYELGFICGRKIKVVKKSLIKKTILVEIENYLLSLRCTVAQIILVE